MGLINFSDVHKSYNNQHVLRGVSFTVERGERVALVGPNGAGKTTLLRIAQGQETADLGAASIARGIHAGFLGQDLAQLEGDESAAAWREVDDMEQRLRELEAQMAQPGADLAELYRKYEHLTARFEALDGYTVEARLKAMLIGLGLRREALTTPLHLLSSGEKMRAALARILLKSPDLLVLDEPTNHLDISALTWLENFLIKFEGGVLLISHDRYFLDRVATRVVELSGGTVIDHRGNYSGFLEQQNIRRAFALKESDRLSREILREKELMQSMRHMRRISAMHMHEKRLDRLLDEQTELREGKQAAHIAGKKATSLNLTHAVHTSAEIAEAEGLCKRFGERVLLCDAHFLVRGGEKVGIIGDNGCGKTTLLRMLLGVDTDFTGVCRLGPWVKYALLDQNSVFEDESRTAIDEVIAAKEMTPVQALRELARVGLYGEEAEKRIAVLSGGERVRLKLCLAMIHQPDCLVLDEPTNHLDLPARESFETALRGFQGSVLAVSHDRYFLTTSISRLLVFKDMKIESFQGNYDDYRVALEGGGESAGADAAGRTGGGSGAAGSRGTGPTGAAPRAAGSSGAGKRGAGSYAGSGGADSSGLDSDSDDTGRAGSVSTGPRGAKPGDSDSRSAGSNGAGARGAGAQPLRGAKQSNGAYANQSADGLPPSDITPRDPSLSSPASPHRTTSLRGKAREKALSALETRIVRLEMEKADLESRFGEDQRGEIFAEYGRIENELEQLNGEWDALAMVDE